MRKCLDCGKELKDFELKCSECLSDNLSLINEEQESAREKKPKSFLILLIVIVIIGFASAIFAYNYLNKTVPAEPIKEAVASLYSGDLEGYIEPMHSEFKPDAESILLSEYESYQAYTESIKETLENAYGDNYKIDTQVIDTYKYSDKIVEFLNEAVQSIGYDVEITSAYHVTVRVVTGNDDGAETYYVADDYSCEIDGKWYFVPKNMLVSE